MVPSHWVHSQSPSGSYSATTGRLEAVETAQEDSFSNWPGLKLSVRERERNVREGRNLVDLRNAVTRIMCMILQEIMIHHVCGMLGSNVLLGYHPTSSLQIGLHGGLHLIP